MNTTPLPRLTSARLLRSPSARAFAFAFVVLALPCLINAQSEQPSERPSERIETTTIPIMPMSTIDRQRRSTTDDKPPSSKLRGRVVYDDTGRPVRRARVRLLEDGSTTGTGATAP